MKTSKFIFTLATMILSCYTFALSQNKEKIEPLAASATLAESHLWLTKAISKNFGYRTIADSVKISNLKFDGCRISYRVFQTYTDQKAALGDRPALGNTGSTAAKDIGYSVYEDVSFDLKDINASQVKREILSQPKEMQIITLETNGKKDVVAFNR